MAQSALQYQSPGVFRDSKGNLVASMDGKTVSRVLRAAPAAPGAVKTQPVGAAKPIVGTPAKPGQPSITPTYTPPKQIGASTDLYGNQSRTPGNLQSIIDQATGGTINSFNTSANRLRERLDSANTGNLATVTDRNLSRGFGNSGLNDADINTVNSNNQENYAQGLDTLSGQFEGFRQQGLATAAGTAATENNRDTSNMQAKNQANLQYQGQQNQNSQNSADRSLQEILAELMQKNENYRSAMGVGANQSGTTVPTNTALPSNGGNSFQNSMASTGRYML